MSNIKIFKQGTLIVFYSNIFVSIIKYIISFFPYTRINKYPYGFVGDPFSKAELITCINTSF